ncbi:MAG: class I adenylate-forming enzyme family protein [Candidatus Zixiibacteriota bacterium]
MKSIAENFLATADRVPDKTFLVGPDNHRFTYAQVLSRARRFATLLESNNVGAGDRVILTFPNSVNYLCAYLGTLMRGCTALLVDPRSRPAHLEYVRSNCDAKAWMSHKSRAEYDHIQGQIRCPHNLDPLPEMPLEKLCADKNPLALIMYTSGATGIPKGVCLSHDNLQHTIRSIISWAKIEESDRELTTLSLTHLFGLAHVHIYWTLGGTVYLEEKLQDIPRLMQRITDEQITSFPGTPGGFKMILDQFADLFANHAGRLKYIVVNSAPMAEEYIKKMLELLPNTRFYMYYGLTEASRSSYICYNDNRTKLKSVGRPTPGAEVVVGTPDKPLTNEVGEVLIRGPHLTKGYWGINSSEYFLDGWFRTGDLGIMDADGFLTWEGRLKEQINIDGLKLTPMEVESVLMDHPRVKDCAVVGASDEMTGEVVVGFVVPNGAPSRELEIELRRHCKDRLEIYKIPKKIVFIDEIPRTDTGKTKRMSLKERLQS